MLDRETKQPFPVGHDYTTELGNIFRREGLMARVQGNKIILSPPLVIQQENIDEALRIFDLSFAEMGDGF